jgi:hypothetical protein
MRGRKRSGLRTPARTPDVVSHQDDAPIDADAQTDAALLALVRLLARQAAREVFATTVPSRIVPSTRTANESCHLRPLLLRESARGLDR